MEGPVHISETRQGKTLARIALWGERLAEMCAERAEAAETAEDFKIYVDSFAKVTRGVRMTLALENRLMRDTARHDREHRAELDLQTKEAKARRRQRLWNDLAGEACTEYEELDFREEVLADLQDRLEEEVRLATFLDETFEAQLDRLKHAFGLGRYASEDDEPDSESVSTEPEDTS